MTTPNMYDLVIDELHKVRVLVKDELSKQYKRTKPFRMEPMSNDELLIQYEALTPEDINNYIQQYGEDSVNQMIFKMETLKQKRGVR